MSAPGLDIDPRPVPSAVLAAQVQMLIGELREHRRECVPRGEYDIARAADLARLAVVEAEIARQGNRRWQIVALGIGAAGTIFASLLTAALAITLKLN